MKATEAREKLNALASPEMAASSARFFKTGPGEYGEGDTFIGVRVPTLRKLARECRAMPLTEIEAFLHSPVHEKRLLALLVLVLGVGKCDDENRKAVFNFYLDNTQHVNNGDLVDSPAPAIVATQHFIRLDQFDVTLTISRLLLADKEDLIHKATGWMLREVGDRDECSLVGFLDEHAAAIPRTMLRYAIKKLSPEIRLAFLDPGRPAKSKRGGG